MKRDALKEYAIVTRAVDLARELDEDDVEALRDALDDNPRAQRLLGEMLEKAEELAD